jgi:hypothetical protein
MDWFKNVSARPGVQPAATRRPAADRRAIPRLRLTFVLRASVQRVWRAFKLSNMARNASKVFPTPLCVKSSSGADARRNWRPRAGAPLCLARQKWFKRRRASKVAQVPSRVESSALCRCAETSPGAVARQK